MRKTIKIVFGLLIVFVAVLAIYFYFAYLEQKKIEEIKNFKDCAAAGYPILETYPEQCRTPDGRSFTKEISDKDKEKLKPPSETCENLCGDRVCQEIVCMAVGCPCAETKASCPQDCK